MSFQVDIITTGRKNFIASNCPFAVPETRITVTSHGDVIIGSSEIDATDTAATSQGGRVSRGFPEAMARRG